MSKINNFGVLALTKMALKLIFKMLKLVFKIPELQISSCTSFARTWMGKLGGNMHAGIWGRGFAQMRAQFISLCSNNVVIMCARGEGGS